MAIINTGQTFTATETVTNTKLQDIASAATFNDPVDETSLELITTGLNVGKLGVKDNGITPDKLSGGGPSWDDDGVFLVTNVTAPGFANSLILRSDRGSPDPINGGAQISLHSSDSSVPNQIYVRSAFTYFKNMAGATVASIGSAGPSADEDLTTKKYVDEGGGFTPSTYAGEESVTLPNGLIMKWGVVTADIFGVAVSFESAFPTGVVSASACPNSADALTQSTGYSGKASVDSLTTTGMNVSCDGSAYWQAIGR